MKRMHLIQLVLLAAASLLTTALLAIIVFSGGNEGSASTVEASANAQQVSGDPLFQQGLALPDFTLTERGGDKFNVQDLRGKVWIADFIFTRCAGPCSAMTLTMARVQDRLKTHPRWNDIRLVSVTVDPDYDTPLELAEYATRYNADAGHWLFLTGPRQDVWRIIRDDFHLPVEDDAENSVMPIIHSQKFVLVDQQGRIRRYYDALETDEMTKMLNDLDRVLAEGK